MKCRFPKSEGQVSLPVILLITGIIIEMAVAGSFVSYFMSTGGLGERLAARARVVALSGIFDVFVKIARNKEFTSAVCPADFHNLTPYSLNVGSDRVDNYVCRAVNDQLNVYTYTVNSVSTAASRQKRFVGTITVDEITGVVKLRSIVEAPVS